MCVDAAGRVGPHVGFGRFVQRPEIIKKSKTNGVTHGMEMSRIGGLILGRAVSTSEYFFFFFFYF
jgi:hypothetical protein